MYGAIELGGTKVICGVSEGPRDFVETARINTRDPQTTLAEIIDFFQRVESKYSKLKSLGLASFGPVDLNTASTSYGSLLKTPKKGWSNFPLLSKLQEQFAVPMGITTDVNAALLAEHKFGAAKGVDNAIYVTIGTGVGAGVLVNGQLANGFMHPEIGHMRIPHDGVAGICPFHGNCLEGLASGPAIAARAGRAAEELAQDHPVWDSIAANLADMCNNLLMTFATERIILGGGVMARDGLLNKVKHHTNQKLNGYLPIEHCTSGLDDLIVGASVDEGPGLVGALLLAQQVQ